MTVADPGPSDAVIDSLVADILGPVLDLSYQSFDDLNRFDRFVQALGNSRQIFVLHLARCQLTLDHSVLLAKALAVNRSIQILDVSGCGLRDDTIAELTPSLIKMPFLIRLSLQHNDIEEAGSAMIASVITANLALRSIQLAGNPFQNNAEGVAVISTALKSRPDLINDLVWDVPAKVKPVLDAAEKKFQALPIRMRYADFKPLHVQWFECVKTGSVVQVTKFLKTSGRDFNPGVVHPEGFTALHVAAANGHSKLVKELLKLGVPSTRTLGPLGGDSQWYSVTNAAGNLIRFALPQRSTPIFFAVAADDAISVKALIQAGEKAQEPNAAGLWPHDYATPKCETELPPVDKEKASKAEADRIAKLTKGGSKKKAKK